MIVPSSRFPKPSRLPSLLDESPLFQKDDGNDRSRKNSRMPATLTTEPTFGLFSCLDSGFSFKSGDMFTGPVLVDSDSLVVRQGCLFRYGLGMGQLSFCCQLPNGEAKRIDVARDADGFCIGALLFYDGESEVDSNSYADPEPPEKYVLCTKRENENWNVSEPTGGKTGCFLGASGEQDKIFVVSSSGSTASIFSFAAPSSNPGIQQVRQSRGVQRFKLISGGVRSVFRTPFAQWNAVLYHDCDNNRLVVSKNAFDADTYRRDSYQEAATAFAMDDDTAVPLRENEIVVDVRWQKLPSRSEQYIGAIMTDKRIFFVRHILSIHSVFDMQSIMRKVVPFCVPNMAWVGPSILLAHGNSVFSIALNSQADLVANLSNGGYLPALVACLPERIVYTTSSLDASQCSLAVATRPYSPVSSTVRGMLSFENLKTRRSPDLTDKVKEILDTHDASQASAELTDSLIENRLTPLAYLISVSAEGKGSLSPLRRSALLGRLGDFKGALTILEEELMVLRREVFHEIESVGEQTGLSYGAGEFDGNMTTVMMAGRLPGDGLEEEQINSSDDDLFSSTKQETGLQSGNGEGVMQEVTPTDDGDLTEITRKNTEETRRMLGKQKEKNDAALREMKVAASQMVASQRNLHASGTPSGSTRALEIFERSVRKYSDKRFVAAQNELDSALRSILRGRERGIGVTPELLNGIVLYQMACRIRIAMDEIASGEHANTIPGRVTYSQLANGLTKLLLTVQDRIDGLIQAVDANILLGNFGSAAQYMRLIHELGVPNDFRASLRDKYAACQTRGFVDTMPQSVGSICFQSLKVIGSSRFLRCTVCPALFATDVGIPALSICPCCGVGQVISS
ncbi:unnamed protein product [Agarophyton chilense]